MNKISHLKTISFSLMLAVTMLLSLLTIASSAAERKPDSLAVQDAPAAPNLTPTLHYKSREGLMPPAYSWEAEGIATLKVTNALTIPFLSPYLTQTIGSWPQVLAGADLTGDGENNLALATDFYFDPPNDERLHLFSQIGTTLSRTQLLTGGRDPKAMIASDLNTDGRVDVAVALARDDIVAVYTQTLSQTIAGPVHLPLPGAPNALAAGDFSHDMRNDLAAIAPLAEVIQLWGADLAGLSTVSPPLPYPTGGYDDLAVGDFDNDGDDDLAAMRGAGYTVDSVIIYLQEGGTFPISYTLSPEVGFYLPHGLAVGDVNNDGLDDVVVTGGGNYPDAYLSVFVQESGALTTTPTVYPAFHLPSAVVVEDLNHDGRQDVTLLHDGWPTLSFYEQKADGTLDDYGVTTLPYISYYYPDALALVDFTGDGGLDIAAVGYYEDLVKLTNTLVAPHRRHQHPPPRQRRLLHHGHH